VEYQRAEGLEGVSVESAIKDLEQLLPQLAQSDRQFADSLINGPYGFKRRGYLTDKQSPHVYRLLERAVCGVSVAVKANLGNMANINDLFAKAKQFLKYPKVVLDYAGLSVKLWVQGERAKYPGAVGIMVDKVWAGRIHSNGDFEAGRAFDGFGHKEAVMDLLGQFAENPAKIAAACGKLASRCCFCQKTLEDPKSLAMGYGKTCAGHYHLPWGEAKVSMEQVAA
jgi:hypothetical protein